MLPSLVTLDEIKQYISVQDEDETFDAQLMNLAQNATKLLETFCRRKFAEDEYVDYFTARNSGGYSYDITGNASNTSGILEQEDVQRFGIKGYPVNLEQAFTVKYDPSRAFGDDTALAEAEFFFDESKNAVYVTRALSAGKNVISVEYTAGYSVTEEVGTGDDAVTYDIISGAPEDLKMACVTQVVFMFNKYREGNIGLVGADRHSPQYEKTASMLCSEAQAFAAPYVRRQVGQR